jgi:hypothetical protein
VGYTFIGDPSGLELRDQWYYDVGLGYYLTEDILISGYYEEWRSLVEEESNPRDLFFTLNYRFSSQIEFTAGMLFGLSDGAPDYGLSGGVRLKFQAINRPSCRCRSESAWRREPVISMALQEKFHFGI